MRVVVKVGAYNGEWSIHESRREDTFIYIVEPAPDNYLHLISNITKARIHNILPLNFALSNKTGTQTLYLRPNGFNEGHSLKHRINEPVVGAIKVKTLTWDDFIQVCHITHVNLCYIDAEGSEQDIIEKMTVCYPKRLIVSNYHSGKFKDVMTNTQLQKLITQKNYRITEVKQFEIIAEKQ